MDGDADKGRSDAEGHCVGDGSNVVAATIATGDEEDGTAGEEAAGVELVEVASHEATAGTGWLPGEMAWT